MTRSISFLFGVFARIRNPRFLIQPIITVFVKLYDIDLSKSEKTDFISLNDLFTRKIKKNFSYNLQEEFIHPCEGKLISFGQVKNGQTFLIKGKRYSVKELIGVSDSLEDFYFYNYYLSPQDYHRVHHPVTGRVTFSKEIQGPLYPVAPWFIKLMPSVFAKNYRTVTLVQSKEFGPVFTVMVGALNVGSIKMALGFINNEEVCVRVGDELGVFEMGSSVVLFTRRALKVKKGKVFFESV